MNNTISNVFFIFKNIFRNTFKYYLVSYTDGRFQFGLFIFITYFSTVVPFNSCVFFPVDLSSLMRHFEQVLKGVEVFSVSWFGQLTVGVQITDYFNCCVWNTKKQPPPNTCSMMSSQDKMTQCITFFPHQQFELQDEQPRPSNKRNFETKQLK